MSKLFQQAAEGYEAQYEEERKQALVDKALVLIQAKGSLETVVRHRQGLTNAESVRLQDELGRVKITEVPNQYGGAEVFAKLARSGSEGNSGELTLDLEFVGQDSTKSTANLLKFGLHSDAKAFSDAWKSIPDHRSDDYREIDNILNRISERYDEIEQEVEAIESPAA